MFCFLICFYPISSQCLFVACNFNSTEVSRQFTGSIPELPNLHRVTRLLPNLPVVFCIYIHEYDIA
jgi:hypothetical protein